MISAICMALAPLLAIAAPGAGPGRGLAPRNAPAAGKVPDLRQRAAP
jgi:hypothetical protein